MQSKFRDPEESVNTDGILSDILDMKKQQQRVSEIVHWKGGNSSDGKGGNLSDGKGGNLSDGKEGNSSDSQSEKGWKCAIPVIPIAVHLVKLIIPLEICLSHSNSDMFLESQLQNHSLKWSAYLLCMYAFLWGW